MQSLTQLVVASLELLEAEGRALRCGMAKTAGLLIGLIVAGIVALAGFGMLVWALYLGFAVGAGITPAWSAFWTGIITVVAAGVISWLVKNIAK